MWAQGFFPLLAFSASDYQGCRRCTVLSSTFSFCKAIEVVVVPLLLFLDVLLCEQKDRKFYPDFLMFSDGLFEEVI